MSVKTWRRLAYPTLVFALVSLVAVLVADAVTVRPAAIAVHDDGDMARQPAFIELCRGHRFM